MGYRVLTCVPIGVWWCLLPACLNSPTALNAEGGSVGAQGGNAAQEGGSATQEAATNVGIDGHDLSETNSASGQDAASASDGAVTTEAPYHVMGVQILDRNGHPHLFRGLDRPSLEWSCSGDIVEANYETMAMVWHANVVRVSLNQDCWIQDPNNNSYDASYQAVVDDQVQWAKKYGMDIILDLHWSDRGDYAVGYNCLNTANSNCQQDMADTHSVTFWQQVAEKYKSDPQVMFELYNEPRIGGSNPTASAWDTWLNGGQSGGFAVHGMLELYTTVRSTGADNLVIIGGLSWAFDLSGLASHAVAGSNIVYNTHVYNQNPMSQWYAKFGSFAGTYPIIATEFGDASGSCSTGVVTDFTSYANGNPVSASNAPPNKLSWTAWAFYAARTPCSFPSLVNSDYVTPNAMGQVVQNALIAGP
jgi:endoglucanase